MTATVAQWVRALAPHAEGWVFESLAATDLSRKKQVMKALMLGNRCECHESSEMTIMNGCPMSH